jgi:hypothetical protein
MEPYKAGAVDSRRRYPARNRCRPRPTKEATMQKMQKIMLVTAFAMALGACASEPEPTVTTTRTTVTTTAPASVSGACQAVDEDGNAIAVPC